MQTSRADDDDDDDDGFFGKPYTKDPPSERSEAKTKKIPLDFSNNPKVNEMIERANKEKPSEESDEEEWTGGYDRRRAPGTPPTSNKYRFKYHMVKRVLRSLH